MKKYKIHSDIQADAGSVVRNDGLLAPFFKK